MKRVLPGLLALVLAVVLAACTRPGGTEEPTDPASSPSPTPVRAFTVATTEKASAFDPVAVTDAASTSVVLVTFQRMLTTDPGRTQLRPDAAKDCRFSSELVYDCTLNDNLHFANGHDLTASDVAFSINRALRLGVSGSSAWQLHSLDHVETVGDTLVRFVLRYPDTQFGYALASPAASIVDEQVYDPDAIRDATMAPVGSGPYYLSEHTDQGLTFRRQWTFKGYAPAASDVLRLAYFADSAGVEEAMRTGAVDVVWRGLSAAALKRFDDQIRVSRDQTTEAGFRRDTLSGVRVHFVVWRAGSAYRLDAALRTTVSQALQEERTLDSVIPGGIEGHVPAFALGGQPSASARPTLSERPKLTMSYSASIVGERELARDLRDRLETAGGVSVQLVPDAADADLALVNYRAWTPTAMAWAQPYLENPLPGSASKLASLTQIARSTTDVNTRDSALAEIQQQAQADAIVLPVSQLDDDVFYSRTAVVHEPRFGPGWQLGLWAVGRN